ncbi:MAG: hypothetical protein GC159_08430 [Phycisphaera sp.]|nr:hypothetical protein [Phycisphaera sp.]
MSQATPSPKIDTRPVWRRMAFGWPAVVVLLATHYLMALSSVTDLGAWLTADPAGKSSPYELTYTRQSHTFDEPTHMVGGYTYWRLNDYRILPENGNLPQRFFAIPSAIRGGYELPPHDQGVWRRGAEWTLVLQFFYTLGNDYESFVFSARCMAILLSVFVLIVVWVWTKRLFGPEAALLALTVATFSPTMLANASICTSDMAVTLFFAMSLGALWRALHRLTPWTLLASCVTAGLLQVAKFNGLLVLPMVAALLTIRLAAATPITVQVGRWQREIVGRAARAGVFAGVFVTHVLVVIAIIWAFYGFRYSYNAYPEERADSHLNDTWDALRINRAGQEDIFTHTIDFAREHELLPEAYLYGVLFVQRHSVARTSYLNGEWRTTGWWYFFPYCFAVKTPVGVFLLILLAAAAIAQRLAERVGAHATRPPPTDTDSSNSSDSSDEDGAAPSTDAPTVEHASTRGEVIRQALYRTAPLWVLAVIYWAFAMTANLNIGLRHVLPTYPVMYIFIGAAAEWVIRRHRLLRPLVILGVMLVVIASVSIWPHYLAYFNVTVGPKNGYRHLVDSNLDWGQEVPGVIHWLDDHGLNEGWRSPIKGDAFKNWLTEHDLDPQVNAAQGARVYLAYFGSANPYYHGVHARQLPSYYMHAMPGVAPGGLELYPLTGGTYLISATQLSNIYVEHSGRGRWTVSNQRYFDVMHQKYSAVFARLDPKAKPPVLIRDQGSGDEYWGYQILRFARLCQYLKQREPDDTIGYGMLIYQLTDEEVDRALNSAIPLEPDQLPPH